MKLNILLSNGMVYVLVDGIAVWVGTLGEWTKAIATPTKVSKVES